jgi:hypothetical protein
VTKYVQLEKIAAISRDAICTGYILRFQRLPAVYRHANHS